MFDFLLHFFVVPGVVQWIMKQKRWSQRTKLLLSVAFLAAYGIISVIPEMSDVLHNHYQVLGVGLGATQPEIRKAYKRMSLQYHPDKNPGPGAEERFSHIRTAYEVLSDPRVRTEYDLWGEESDSLDDNHKLVLIAQFYVMMGVLTFLLTMGRAQKAGRMYISAFLVMLAGYETAVRFRWMHAAAIGITITPHQQIAVLQKLFAPFMQGARIISETTFVDMDLELQRRLQQVWLLQLECMREIRDIKARLAAGSKGRGGAAEGIQPAMPPGLAARVGSDSAVPDGHAGEGPTARRASAKKRGKRDKTGAAAAAAAAGEAGAGTGGQADAMAHRYGPVPQDAIMQPPKQQREWTPILVVVGIILLRYFTQ